jgi:segregation and condensation protein B
MDRTEQRRIVEALVLASPEPISAARLAELIPYVKPAQAKDLVSELNTQYQDQDRAFEIWEVAGGFQVRTRAEFSGYLQKLNRQRPLRLSRAALETLSIVAYKQPATRAEIEEVRGVECGPVLKSLLERQLIRIAGHRDIPGRPMIYVTTRRFLEVFGLESIKGLPALRELDELAREQGLTETEDTEGAPDETPPQEPEIVTGGAPQAESAAKGGTATASVDPEITAETEIAQALAAGETAPLVDPVSEEIASADLDEADGDADAEAPRSETAGDGDAEA